MESEASKYLTKNYSDYFIDYCNSIKNKNMDDRLKNVDLIAELDGTFRDVAKQLVEDEKRWGDTWKERGKIWNGMSQEERFMAKMQEYYADYHENGTSFPWLKVIGEAHIALVREKNYSS